MNTVPDYVRVTESGIYGFFGDYEWLSNFTAAAVVFEGKNYPSVEHAYQAAKTLDQSERIPFTLSEKYAFGITAGQAKKEGRKLKVRDDWEDVKYGIMLALVFEKFKNNIELRQKLVDTDNLYLEETNHWGDNVWGVDYRADLGTNWLGQILMDVRRCFKSEAFIMNAIKDKRARLTRSNQ